MRTYKNYIFDIVISALAAVLGVVMLPPFGIGQRLLNLLLAISLVAYLAIHLFGKLQSHHPRYAESLSTYHCLSKVHVVPNRISARYAGYLYHIRSHC